METTRYCSTCGKPLEASAPQGLCPACLMQGAFPTGTDSGAKTPRFTPPKIEELAARFPQLEILSFVGQGGMGAVYRARQKELDRVVALKILPPDIGKDGAFAARFMREARALARLNHPGIVTIYDFGRVDGLYFFLMEYVDGVSLQQLLARRGVSTREALAIVPQICDALQYAHDQGIVHRDIKPENILLDRRGSVKVADFGLAKIMGGGELPPAPGASHSACALTETGKVVGTPQYMSPEQTDHPGAVDHRADIYALGVVFYQMLTGELPGKPIEPPSKKVVLDVRLDEVVLRALEAQPERRYQQVSEVKTNVETITSTMGGGAPVTTTPDKIEPAAARWRGLLLTLGVLAGLLALLFWRSFVPGNVLFSNDRPLGLLKAEWMRLPSGVTGRWADLNSLGFNAGSFGETITTLLLWGLGPVGSSKFLAPVSLCLLGMGAWFSFRRLGLARPAALLGALAVTLNSVFFSTSCWGCSEAVLGMAMIYLGLGLVTSAGRAARRWERWAFLALAGLAVGVGVLEGAETAAIAGVVVLASLVHGSLLESGSLPAKLARGLGQTLVVAAFAALTAGQVAMALLNSSLQGAEVRQEAPSKAQRWNFATQWSLPKLETAALVVPGLFGYRMDTPEGGQYWGGIGRDPAMDEWLTGDRSQPRPLGFWRFVGGGIYLGVPVVLVALWAAGRAFRKKETLFTPPERRWLWFWTGVAVVCLVLAFGRFTPFYRWVYALPGFATVRNPVRFLNLMVLAVSMLFAYGLMGLWRQHLGPSGDSRLPWRSRMKAWWSHGDRYDRWWAIGCAAAWGLSVAAWLVFAASQTALHNYLQSVGFDSNTAQITGVFSRNQAAWFLLFLLLGAVLLVLLLSGVFAGSRARWGGLLLGLLVAVDLGRANLPWIVHQNYLRKYAANDVLKFLQQQPCEHRVTKVPLGASPEFALLDSVYYVGWAQHHFPYYGIQCLDVVTLPRLPKDLAAFERQFHVPDRQAMGRLARRWQLTNTRYLLGPAALLQPLNEQFDPAQQRFRIAHTFDLVAAQDSIGPGATSSGAAVATGLDGITALFRPDGRYAIFEFTGALPRARLYSHWQVNTNDAATLEQLAHPDFDPERAVLVSTSPQIQPAAERTNAATAGDSGTVEFVSYASKEIVLRTQADFPAVLLLNDRFDPQWRVTVDDQPATLLRCNYLMRGVSLSPGSHTVRFRFQIPIGLPLARLEVEPDTQVVSFVFHVPTGLPSYVTLAAYCLGLVLIVLLARRHKALRLSRKP